MLRLEQIATGVQRAGAWVAPLTPDALMVLGAGSIAYGAWLLHAAAGFVVGGAFSLGAGILAARKASS